jgi:hypothetical protein
MELLLLAIFAIFIGSFFLGCGLLAWGGYRLLLALVRAAR